MFPCTEAQVDRLFGRIEMQAISMTKVVSGVRGFRPQRAQLGWIADPQLSSASLASARVN